jgi:hypothetical protein
MRQNPTPARKRTRRRARQRAGIKVYQIHCKACGKRYELSWTGEVKYCSFCSSDQIAKAVRERRETSEERAAREQQQAAFWVNAIGGVLGSVFGFQPSPNYPAPANGHKPSELEQELLKEGYRKLAIKYHPDKGGDPEKMKELNRLKDRLLGLCPGTP